MAPQFKKLTDCPENLREAIDWLIQVRHGSGPGDKGLDELAKALKKLIDEAIKKTYTSFCDYLCTSLDPAGQRYDCCRDKCEAIKALKENVDKAGNAEADKLERLLENVRTLKTGCETNHRVDSSTDRALDDVQSRLENLEGLRKNLSVFTSDPSPILKQLCNGLETFLGFNKDSKGYDGTGIVYSDLDRLCDGVMGFLYGVLDAVKDDDTVTTYDDNVSNSTSNIYRACQHLSQNLHAGKSGFGSSVEKVKQGIEGYLGQMKTLTYKVVGYQGALNRLEEQIEKNITSVQGLDTLDGFDAAQRKWYATVSRGLGSKVSAVETAISALDPQLKKILRSSVDKILIRIKNLEKIALNDEREMEGVRNKVTEQLTGLSTLVTEEALKQGQACIETLQRAFSDKIHLPVIKIMQALQKVQTNLQSWNEKSKKIVQKALKRCAEIVDKLNGGGDANTERSAVENAADALYSKAYVLLDAIELARNTLSSTVTAALQILVRMNSSLMMDLHDLNTAIKKEIGTYVDNLKKSFKAGIGAAKELPGSTNRPGVKALAQELVSTQIMAGVREKLHAAAERESVLVGALEWALNALYPWKSELGEPLEELNTALSQDLQGCIENALPLAGHAVNIKSKSTLLQVYKTYVKQEKVLLAELEALDGILPGAIKTIRTQVREALTKQEADKITGTVLKKDIGEFVSKFDEFTKAVKDLVYDKGWGDGTSPAPDRGVHYLLQDMQKMHNKSNKDGLLYDLTSDLEDIKKAIGRILTKQGDADSMSTLQEIIRQAGVFHESTVSGTINMCTAEINSFVKKEVAEKIERIKYDALQRYVACSEKQLLELKNCVVHCHKAMIHIIEEDEIIGLKGLLRRLNIFVSGVKNIFTPPDRHSDPPTNSPLTQAALYVHTGFNGVFRSLLDQGDMKFERTSIEKLNRSLHELFQRIHKSQHYDYEITSKMNVVMRVIYGFNVDTLPDAPRKVLSPLKSGLEKFAAKLNNAYVSKYSGRKWVELIEIEQQKCAKIFCTIFPILNRDMKILRMGCRTDWKDNKLTLTSSSEKNNRLGKCLEEFGYRVSLEDSVQHGELNNDRTGHDIYSRLTSNSNTTLKYNIPSSTVELHARLTEYYKVCHYVIHPKPTPPRNIYQMLEWLCGLPYNPVYSKLKEECKTSFGKPKGREQDDYSTFKPYELTLVATTEMSAECVISELEKVCYHAEKVLIAIQGNGHAEGRYSCDFSTNVDQLSYPPSPAACFELLTDILSRIYHRLYFLLVQCSHKPELNGWSDCWYGSGVAGSSWGCNDLRCPYQMGDQIHTQSCDQNCSQKAECGLKSPLQSFLEDGLPGFLPHSFTKPGCKLECSVSNHNGIPCITPMGFKDLSVRASHRQTGQHIYSVLNDFCGYSDKPLSRLYAYVLCLLRTPPTTLGDMFAFYYNFLNGSKSTSVEHKMSALHNAVIEANFENSGTNLDVTPMFGSRDHSQKTHDKGDLQSLVSCDLTYTAAYPCGSYVRPLTRDVRCVFSSEHKMQYLSWILYITETFHRLLKQLYDECCKNCSAEGTICYELNCPNSCTAKNKETQSSTAEHQRACKSIVMCNLTLPTLHKYGLYFGSATWLSGAKDHRVKRTCEDFCSTLKTVVSDSSVLSQLIHVTIPEFLWEIRGKFFWTTVALWLLSFLYLLHILIIRLDLLHIKSHLHSPSSHRIAAQSLLAAARVGRLSKISYLQP